MLVKNGKSYRSEAKWMEKMWLEGYEWLDHNIFLKREKYE